MIAECNECGKAQELVPKKERMSNRIDKHYFQCKHCNFIYIIGYTDEDIRREQKRIRKLIKKSKGNGIYADKIEQKEALITNKMNELKEKIETLA